MLLKCCTYMSTNTHDANMLQLRNRYELTHQHWRQITKWLRNAVVILFMTPALGSVSFWNYHECRGCLNSCCKGNKIDKDKRNFTDNYVSYGFRHSCHFLMLLACHDLSLSIQIQPRQRLQTLLKLACVMKGCNVPDSHGSVTVAVWPDCAHNKGWKAAATLDFSATCRHVRRAVPSLITSLTSMGWPNW